jgi:hypothetical protein
MIVAVEDRLRLLLTSTTGDDDEHVIEVWEMASYVDERWEKEATVSLNRPHAQERRDTVLRDLCSSHVAFLDGLYRLMC